MKLDEEQRETMYKIRKKYYMNFDELASVLNCRKEHMVDAQIGKEVPNDVYKAVLGYLEVQSLAPAPSIG